MSHLFRAATAFLLVALVTGHLPSPGPHWRAVAADIHQARPQGGLPGAFLSLLRSAKG
jgi:hypothetical protein